MTVAVHETPELAMRDADGRSKLLLSEAHDMIADPTRWIQSAVAVDRSAVAVEPGDDSAQAFCALGAVEHIARGNPDIYRRLYPGIPESDPLVIAFRRLALALPESHPPNAPYTAVCQYNDSAHRNHSDVLLLYRNARNLELPPDPDSVTARMRRCQETLDAMSAHWQNAMADHRNALETGRPEPNDAIHFNAHSAHGAAEIAESQFAAFTALATELRLLRAFGAGQKVTDAQDTLRKATREIHKAHATDRESEDIPAKQEAMRCAEAAIATAIRRAKRVFAIVRQPARPEI